METKEIEIIWDFERTKLDDKSFILPDKEIKTSAKGTASISISDEFQLPKSFIKKCEKTSIANGQSIEVLIYAYLGMRWSEVFKNRFAKANVDKTSHQKVVKNLNKNVKNQGVLLDFAVENFTETCEIH